MATVIPVRRVGLMVAVLTALVPARPAAAHSCATAMSVTPGERSTITIGVAAEESPVIAVTVSLPGGFRLDDVPQAVGWSSTTDGGSVRFTGGTIPPFTCSYLTLVGVAEGKATLVFPLTVRDDTNTTREYSGIQAGDSDAAQLVYAGTSPDNDTGHGVAAWQVALLVLFAVGLVAGVVAVSRFEPRRRRR